jgi:hypothetical protein
MNYNNDQLVDYLIAALFLVLGVYAYWEARTFGGQTDLWPQLLSMIIVLFSALLLVRNWLPERLREFMSEPSELVQVDQEFSGSETDEEVDAENAEAGLDRPIPPTVFTGLSIVGYIVISYLVGILWASPVFVAVYMLWFEIRPIVVVTMSALSFVIAFGFMRLLFLELDQGIIFGGVF